MEGDAGAGRLIGMTAAFVVLSNGIGAGGYFAPRSHLHGQAICPEPASGTSRTGSASGRGRLFHPASMRARPKFPLLGGV
jgi:hypothetical protein